MFTYRQPKGAEREEKMKEPKAIQLTMDELITLIEALEHYDHTRLNRWTLGGFSEGEDKAPFVDALEVKIRDFYMRY